MTALCSPILDVKKWERSSLSLLILFSQCMTHRVVSSLGMVIGAVHGRGGSRLTGPRTADVPGLFL